MGSGVGMERGVFVVKDGPNEVDDDDDDDGDAMIEDGQYLSNNTGTHRRY